MGLPLLIMFEEHDMVLLFRMKLILKVTAL